ncbi:hypothetical protein RRG08_000191 [Elysia crispata]|uniref:Uncharacterized protein n=1 Tax=Elysia crispata TaxID=231223 RepID=A0AAE1D550_9GAST|nr:hypothetical protein RRG08_000191 [Elysia crispata]
MTGSEPSKDLQQLQKKVFSEDRGIRFWRRCAAEPHCIRLLPENQPRTRNEAILRRVVNPGDLRSYFDHKGRFMYPTRPVAMEMDAIRERRREGLQMVRRHTEILKSIVMKQQSRPKTPDIDFAVMRERLMKARREHAQQVLQRQQLPPTSPSRNTENARDSCRSNKNYKL